MPLTAGSVLSGFPGRQTLVVLIIHGTRKLLDRVGPVTARPNERSTTSLGDWYATVLFWKPQVALFVNEATLLPVLVPLAPAAGVVDRFRAALKELLAAHRIGPRFISSELGEMRDHRLTTTRNRSDLSSTILPYGSSLRKDL